MEPYVIRTSERSSFKRCRQRWDYESALRYDLEPVRQDKSLEFGIAIHKGLEAYYRPERWSFPTDSKLAHALVEFTDSNKKQATAINQAVGLSYEEEQDYKERHQLGVAMLTNYVQWANRIDDFKPLAVEEAFRVPIVDDAGHRLEWYGRPVVYQVRLDMLVEQDDRMWVWDNKTTARFDDTTFLDTDTQISSYALAAQQYYGKPVAGFVYNELRKSAPHPPRVLKSGALSQDKTQSTTYELYVSAIKKLGLDPEPYSDMLRYLSHQPDTYFRRTQIHRSQAELQSQARYIWAEAYDMLNNPSIYPNPNKFNCNTCPFRLPCTIRGEQGNEAFVLNDPTIYRKRQHG